MKASVFIATSVDGFIARQDGGLDWLPAGGGEDHGYNEFFASVDALVIGRKTFETAATFDPWPYGDKLVVVLTTKPSELVAPAGSTCEFIAGTPGEIVGWLSARGLQHLYIDGGLTIQRFLAAGLIQQLTVTHVPVLLGSGIPLFGPVPHDIRLEHVRTRTYQSGLVQSEYTIAPNTPDS
ncbi:MAG: dihydrofolate reductase family protein [Gemmatimonadaceae bacterium]